MIRTAACVLMLLAAAGAAAQQPEPDPDSPETQARAREALSRAEARPIVAETRPIKGINLAVSGQTEGIANLLRDLNAETRGQEVRIALSADVLFDFDKSDLKPTAAPSLEKVAAVLKKLPAAKATIEGHTDAKGNDAYNQKLSERRAESVRKWLANSGVTNSMTARGYGRTKPIAPNTTKAGKDDPEGRQKNRRVDILVEGVER